MKFGAGRQHRYPTGGSGGTGGAIYLVADSNVNTLLGFRGQSHFRGFNGADGDLDYRNGKAGKDLYIPVPKGVIIKDNSTNEVIGELNFSNEKLLVARGGYGGKGNAAFRTGIDKSISSPPTGGEKKWLKIELKLMAAVGLIGLPNAGKSTLLDAITNARPKIANYAFTTIVPNLGVCEIRKNTVAAHVVNPPSPLSQGPSPGATTATSSPGQLQTSSLYGDEASAYDRMVLADIPGIIEGAHGGRGLGRGFLRHVERCRVLLHLIDCTSASPVEDYTTINNELQLFSTTLAQKPQIVVLTKTDLLEGSTADQSREARLEEVKDAVRLVLPHSRLLTISAAAREGTGELVRSTYGFLCKIQRDLDAREGDGVTPSALETGRSEQQGRPGDKPRRMPKKMRPTSVLDDNSFLDSLVEAEDYYVDR